MEIYGFKTENAQKAYDSVNFAIAAQLFKANNWSVASVNGLVIPDEMRLKEIVRNLVKSCENMFLEHGTPEEDDYYAASSGRWTVKYDDCDEYSIMLDFCNYSPFD